MELEKFAKNELDLLGDKISEEIKRKILNSIMSEKIEEGLDGYENLVERLNHWKPLSPLTGEDNEWSKRLDSEENEPSDRALYQNKRCPFVFKIGIDGRPYDSQARIFQFSENGKFRTNRYSAEYIEFPYIVPDEPKKYSVKFTNIETGEEENLDNVKVRYF